MKNIILFGLFLLVCFLTSCRSINTVDKQTYQDLKLGVETFEAELKFYWNNDNNLTPRDRNTKETKLNVMKNAFNSLVIEE